MASRVCGLNVQVTKDWSVVLSPFAAIINIFLCNKGLCGNLTIIFTCSSLRVDVSRFLCFTRRLYV